MRPQPSLHRLMGAGRGLLPTSSYGKFHPVKGRGSYSLDCNISALLSPKLAPLPTFQDGNVGDRVGVCNVWGKQRTATSGLIPLPILGALLPRPPTFSLSVSLAPSQHTRVGFRDSIPPLLITQHPGGTVPAQHESYILKQLTSPPQHAPKDQSLQ